MNRSAEDIEREVEQARGDLDSTVEALKSKMSPGQLIDELTNALKGTGAENMVHNLGSQVRDNPLALAMIGAGMAWLMMGKGTGHGHAHPADGSGAWREHPRTTPDVSGYPIDEVDYAMMGLPPEGQPGAHGLKEKAQDLAAGVKDAAAHARDGVMGAAGHVKHGAQGLGSQATHAGQKLQHTFMDTLEQEPLIVGALGLAVGAAIGASLPATRVEDRTFGKLRDRVVDEGKARAEHGLDLAKDAAEAAYQGARDEAQTQGFAGGGEGHTLADKAESVVRAGVEAAKGKLDEGRAH